MRSEYNKIQGFKKSFFEEADKRYVKIENCNETQNSNNKRFANDDKRIEKLIDRINLWNKLLWVIASSSAGALVVGFFELLLK